MEPEFIRHADTQSNFLSYREEFPDIFPAFPAISLIGITLAWAVVEGVIATSSKGQTWKVVDGRAIYESCSPLLGRSFDVSLDEIASVRHVTESAEIHLRDGSEVTLLLELPESDAFFKYLEELLASRAPEG